MTATRSESTIASSWSCVTKTVVMPRSRCRRLISVRVCTRRLASRLESGSSIRKTAGLRTTARPTATRWRWPPLSSAGTALEQWPQIQHLGRGLDLLADGRPVDPLLAQAEAHIVAHATCAGRARSPGRPWRCCARRGSRSVTSRSSKTMAPGAQPLEAGDAGERRALAAARGAQQRQELAIGDADVEAVDRGDLTVALGQLLQRDASHP